MSNEAPLVPLGTPTTRLPSDAEEFAIGQWYWIKDHGKDKRPWLGCIVHIGSNYVQVEGVGGVHQRVHLDEFQKECTRELEHDRIVNDQVEAHRMVVAGLLDNIKQLTASLGIVPRRALPEEGEAQSQALAVAHGVADVQAHKAALIMAQKETLPALFGKLKEEHEQMALWMKADLIPMKAELAIMQGTTDVIENRIFTVELYAGLIEELTLLADGNPAPNDTKVHLFQRRHYMDEECLAHYEAGGMEFKDIHAFDKWLLKKPNRNRLLPLPRCVVAFRVRRDEKERHATTIGQHIQFYYDAKADKRTFLYIRNGEKIFRLDTELDFGEQLFPERERSALLSGGRLWLDLGWGHSLNKVLSQREYENVMAGVAEDKKRHAAEMRAWKKAGRKGMSPWYDRHNHYVPCTPESVYYDDAMKLVARAALDHNRVAVVLQGLLDRSQAFHPHPPWQLWTASGFEAGIELVYDDSKAITPGAAPDFEDYRMRLNASLTRGSMTVGQRSAWLRVEANKENARRASSWREACRDHFLEDFQPYGNSWPDRVAIVTARGRDGSCHYEWERQRLRPGWVSNPDKPGWMKRDPSHIRCHFRCRSNAVLNVSAYKAGDFKIFYADPRTRAEYLKWAPLLLAAEDYVAGKKDKK